MDEALKDLDKFSKDIEMSVSQIASRSAEEAEAAASGVVVGAAAADVVEVIETAHEYTNNMDQDWECRIPGGMPFNDPCLFVWLWSICLVLRGMGLS